MRMKNADIKYMLRMKTIRSWMMPANKKKIIIVIEQQKKQYFKTDRVIIFVSVKNFQILKFENLLGYSY